MAYTRSYHIPESLAEATRGNGKNRSATLRTALEELFEKPDRVCKVFAERIRHKVNPPKLVSVTVSIDEKLAREAVDFADHLGIPVEAIIRISLEAHLSDM